MDGNYNDIIDVILTLISDDEIASSIAVSGSIVPYLITDKESSEYHSDFYVLVKEKKIGIIRNKLKKLSKEYQFDITSDSKKYAATDYGFKIMYENTIVGFFPYALLDGDLTIRTFSVDKENQKIVLKKKLIPKVSKSSVIRLIRFGKDRKLRIMSPEFILADKETKEKQPGNPTKETMYLLDKVCDESILRVVRQSVNNAKVTMVSKKIKESNLLLTIVLAILLIILLIIAYICFKK